MNASDFGSAAIEDDRSLGHFIDKVEIVFGGAPAIEEGKHDHSRQSKDGRCPDGENDDSFEAIETSREVEKEVKWPE